MDPSAAQGTESHSASATGPGPMRAGAGAGKALTVGEVVARIRGAIEGQFPSTLWVEGELSDCKYHQSGHIYFNLKDERATDRLGQRLVLPCAFFRGANQHLTFKLVDGMTVLCLGQMSTYAGRGQYQLRVLRAEPKGVGALQLAFEQLKKRLQAEGLFDERRKRPMPAMPARVGVITSPSGSAIHDMVSTLRDWFHVIIVPVNVQGDGAASEIAEGIRLANRLCLADVLIVGRGGGSVEDLWAFNDEALARAIAASRIPVISAVGHQDDWTIADYVADRRASTPTDAAKQLVHDQEAVAARIGELVDQLVEGMRRFLEDQAQRLDAFGSQLRLLHPVNHLDRYLQRTAALQARLVQTMRHAVESAERHVQGLAGTLSALSPLAVLSRGYSITLKLPARRVVTTAAAVASGDELETLVAHGRIMSRVHDVTAERGQERHGAD